ncbi:hypothetical protein [Nocardia vaccinii]|uniref:hypothetical protein n=1 Tax=Nocardia vaccinii TaxID=1822 RepID=UPI0012F51394|nr:hypothetical protein [Nocardia vaccinii]
MDDSFYDHPKVLDAGVAAIGLWTLAGAYCARHLTDGVITDRQIRAIGGTRKQAAKLVEVGLWSCDDASPNARRYFFNDWSEYQPSRADVTTRRRDDAERKREARAKKAREQQKRENVRPDVQPDGAQTRPDVSDDRPLYPTRPDPYIGADAPTSGPVLDVANDRAHSRGDEGQTATAGGTLVPLRPPRGGREVAERLNATSHSPEAHSIARQYEQSIGARVPGNVLTDIAQRVDDCLASGVGVEQIARGLVAWHNSPITATSQIPSFVNKAAPKTAQNGHGKPTTRAVSAMELAEQMIAQGVTRE